MSLGKSSTNLEFSSPQTFTYRDRTISQMHNICTFFFWALSACILFDGSFAKSPRFGYTILLDDMSPNQSELRSLLSDVGQDQDRGSTCDAEIAKKVQVKLDSVADQQAKLEGQLQGVEVGLERGLREGQTSLKELNGKLLEVQVMLEGGFQKWQKEMQAKLEADLIAVQNRLEARLEAVLYQIEHQSQAMAKIIALQQVVNDRDPVSATNTTVPFGLTQIGGRFFRIIFELVDWETAERRCREMGGYLASFRNEEEFNAIIPMLYEDGSYWLGINDRDYEGHFVSVASQKPPPFLKWSKGEPDNESHEADCVSYFEGEMWDANCSARFKFICQADNET